MSELIYIEHFGYYKEIEVSELKCCEGCAADGEEYEHEALCAELPMDCWKKSIIYEKVEVEQD